MKHESLDPADLSTAPSADAAGTDRNSEISLADAIAILSRSRVLLASITAVVITIVLVVTLLLPPKYTAYASFLPQTKQLPSNLSGLAAQFGVNIPLNDAGQSPQYYLDVLRSRDLLSAAVQTQYTIATDGGAKHGTLVDFYDVDERTPARRIDKAIHKLNDDLSTTISPKSGIVRLAVTQKQPQLAAMIVARLLGLLTNFNLQTHQSQAAAERRFTERRREEVHRDLRDAENALQIFLQQNRDYRNAPALVFQQDRLARDVATQQQLYTTLSQAYEQAKIEEVRDTPVFTVIETPETPPRPDSRAILLKSVLSLVGGLALGLLVVLAREALLRTRGDEHAAKIGATVSRYHRVHPPNRTASATQGGGLAAAYDDESQQL